MKFDRRLIGAVMVAVGAWASPAWSVESEMGFDYWHLSFYSPSRMYHLKLEERQAEGSNYAEYVRTDRFDHIDNTLHIGYTGRYGPVGWDLKGGFTPKAFVVYRQMGELLAYLPSPGYRIEPFLRGNYRRYTGAKVKTGEFGLRWSPMVGWDVTGRWGSIATELLGDYPAKKKAGSSSYQIGYQMKTTFRLFVLDGRWKEFFDSGNPSDPGEFSIKERGGGFWWSLDKGLRLGSNHTIERRSNDAYIKKYSVTIQQMY